MRAWNQPVSSSIAFVLLLVSSAAMILRPGEMHPALKDLPIYESLIAGALLFGFSDFQRHFKWQNLRQQPATLCVVGVWVAVVLSHLSHFYLAGMVTGATEFLKTLLYFGLVVSLTNSVARLRSLLLVLVLSATTLVGMCVVDYLGVADFAFIDHILDVNGVTDTNSLAVVSRMRGIGIFQDPNDFSLLIVFVGFAAAAFLQDRSQGPARVVWLGPLVVLSAGLIFTKSRGGLLSGGAAFVAFVTCRYGRRAGIAASLFGFAALTVLAAGRANFGLSEGGTGHERFTLWREGLFLLRSPALLFGIGEGFYADWAGLVAHNSFVHAFVELGLFGGTLFFGCFFFPALGLYRLRQQQSELAHPEIVRLFPFVVAILAGCVMGLQSLSRAYVASTYLMLGMQVAYVNLANMQLQPRRLLVTWDRPHCLRLAASSASLFAAFNLFVLVI